MDSHLLVDAHLLPDAPLGDMYAPDLLPDHWPTPLADPLAPSCSSSWAHSDSWDYHDPRFYASGATSAPLASSASLSTPTTPGPATTNRRVYSSRSGSSVQRDTRLDMSGPHALDASSHQSSFDQHALDVQSAQNNRHIFDVALSGFDASTLATFDTPAQSFDTGHLALDSQPALDSRSDGRTRIHYHPQQPLAQHPSPLCSCASCFFVFSQHTLIHAIAPMAQQAYAQHQQQQLLLQSHPQPQPLVTTSSPSQSYAARRSHDEMIDPSRIYTHVSRSTPALSSSSTTSASSASPSPTRSSFSPEGPFAYSLPPPENKDNPSISPVDISGKSNPVETPLPTPPPTAQQSKTSNNSHHPHPRSARPRASASRKQSRGLKSQASESSSEDAPKPAPAPAPKAMHATPSTNHTGRPTLACFFCRQRKIACPPPAPDAEDLSCEQCVSRNQSCVYPTHTRRGLPKDKPAKKFTDEDIRNMGRIAREKEEARRKRRQEEQEAASATSAGSSGEAGINAKMFILEQKSAQGGTRKSKRRKTTRKVIRDDDDFDGDY